MCHKPYHMHCVSIRSLAKHSELKLSVTALKGINK